MQDGMLWITHHFIHCQDAWMTHDTKMSPMCPSGHEDKPWLVTHYDTITLMTLVLMIHIFFTK